MKIYFSNENIKNAISSYIKIIMRHEFEGEFIEKCAGIVVRVLNSMAKDSDEWDRNTQFNILHISEQLAAMLNKRDENVTDKDNVGFVFILTFRFLSEYQLYQENETASLYNEMRWFAKENISEFSKVQSSQINYALYDMSSSILQFLMSSQDFGTMRDFLKAKEVAQQYKDMWDQELKEKKEEVEKLKNALEEYKTGFNFVSLYDGFKELGQRKKSEMRWSRAFMLLIGATIPVVMAFSLYHFINKTYAFASINELVIFVPASAITLVMLYYFRVSLANYNSTRAQLMQIELRMSLCQFIQGYSKYSSEISKENENLLGKFEDVIFSNIMTSEDKIPSTFDGLEQLATLIKAVKIK